MGKLRELFSITYLVFRGILYIKPLSNSIRKRQLQLIKVSWVRFQEEKIPKLMEGRVAVLQTGLGQGRGGPLFSRQRLLFVKSQGEK